ncbi:MAG: hypothetical protein V1900_03215 [Candidatus Aenigmatarchaeota archaeon]
MKKQTDAIGVNVSSYHSKGQNPLLSQTLMVAFSLVLLLAVVTTLNSVRNDYQDFVGRHEIRQVCAIVKSGVEKIYSPGDYNSSTNATMGKILLDLPTRIGDMNYRAKFANTSLLIETTGSNRINDTCKIGFNISYSGSTVGGRTEMSWIRYTNESRIEMRKI